MSRYIDADEFVEKIIERAKDLRQLNTKTIGEALDDCKTINPEDFRPKWISVKERLPNYEERVLVMSPWGIDIWLAVTDEDGTFLWDCGEACLTKDYAQYWMPLPEPPIGTKDEKNILSLADLRPKGKWIGLEYDGYADGNPVYDLWECSNCGNEENGEDVPEQNPFCRCCGAKMEG